MRAEYQRWAKDSTASIDGQPGDDERDLHDDAHLTVPGDLVDHPAGEHRRGHADQRVQDDDDQEDQQLAAVRPREPQHAPPGARRQLPLDHRTVAAQRTQRPHGLHGVHRHRHLPRGATTRPQRPLFPRRCDSRLRSVLALEPARRALRSLAQRVPFGGAPAAGVRAGDRRSATAPSSRRPRRGRLATRLVHSRVQRCPRDRRSRATMCRQSRARSASSAASTRRAGKAHARSPRE